jgi:hypothetical protein
VAGACTCGSWGWIHDGEDEPFATIGYQADLTDQDDAWLRLHYQAGGEPAAPFSRHHGTGSVGALIASYFQTPAFINLAPSSKKTYRIVLERFGALHGHRMVHDMPRAKVAAYIQSIGAERPAMANLTRAVLRKLLDHAIRAGYRNDNPVTVIDTYKSGTRHTWSEEELAAFEALAYLCRRR